LKADVGVTREINRVEPRYSRAVTTVVRLAPSRSSNRAPIELAGFAGPHLLARESDDRLAALVRDGDQNAFAAIVARYSAPLERHCCRILSRSRAEDALQQTFANAYVALSGGAQPDALKPWLYRIARNASVNCLRDRESEGLDGAGELRAPRSPHEIVVGRESLQSVIGAVARLPAQQRHVLIRQEFDGRSQQQIAGELGLSAGAVRQLAHRARRAVRSAAAALAPAPLWQRLPWLLDASDRGQVLLGPAISAAVGKTAIVILMASAAGGAYELSGTPHARPVAAGASSPAAPAASVAGAGRPAVVATRRDRDASFEVRSLVQRGGAGASTPARRGGSAAATPAAAGAHTAGGTSDGPDAAGAAGPPTAAGGPDAGSGPGDPQAGVGQRGSSGGGPGPSAAPQGSAAAPASAQLDSVDAVEVDSSPSADVPDAVDAPDAPEVSGGGVPGANSGSSAASVTLSPSASGSSG
jgi:RNA polymerase sigma factor (sigma-70 family)